MSKTLILNSIEDTVLYKELKKRNNVATAQLVSNLVPICNEASDRIKTLPKFFFEYTLHDHIHFLRITEIMSMILGTSIQDLNDIEIAFLILSAFLHDQGMVLSVNEFEELEKNEEYLVYRDNWFINHPNYLETKNQSTLTFIAAEEKTRLQKIVTEIEAAMLTDYLRVSHGKRSYDYIIKTFSQDKRLEIFGVNLADYLASICISHVQSPDWITTSNGLNYDENIGTFKVNTIFISILLRLADILDFDLDRTPDVLFKSIHFTSPVSILEWQKHRGVKGWEISSKTIRFSMLFDHPVYEKTARTFMNWIDYELSQAHNIVRKFPASLGQYRLNIPEQTDKRRIKARNNSYIYHDIEFSLSRDEIVKLLLTENLYKNPSLFIRELLQNSLDALRLRKAQFLKDGVEWNLGNVKFHHYIDSNGDNIIECIDNGSGMDEEIITNFLGKVGRSYYHSPEFNRLRVSLKENGADFEPCSQFGIGFMSCFMIGDRIDILTRKDYGLGKEKGKPLKIEINGLGGLLVIREGKQNQEIGTSIKIYSREKPIIHDDWSDKISLIKTLKGYAVAAEFPIEGNCNIEGIRGTLIIPPIIDKKQTFLEVNNIKSIRTFEIDFNNINKNLRGYLRQSFLVDEIGMPCIENEEAKWEKITDQAFKDSSYDKMTLLNKLDNQRYDYRFYTYDSNSISLDGILVCGEPGRSSYSRLEMFGLGRISARIYSEHPFLMDVRGDIKPELNPAREPLDKGSIFRTPPRWRKLQNLLDQANGCLWDQILSLTLKGLSHEMFWKLLIIYNGSTKNIPLASLINNLKVPTNTNEWIALSQIGFIKIEKNSIIITDSTSSDYNIEFKTEIKELGKPYRDNGINLNYFISDLFTGISDLCFSNEKILFKVRENIEPDEMFSDRTISNESYMIKCLEFININNEYICTFSNHNLVNLRNPLVQLALESYRYKKESDLHGFAVTLCTVLSNLTKSLKEQNKCTLDVKWRPTNFLGIKYLNVNWNNYDPSYKPPYKIYIDNQTTLEINDEILKKWASLKPNEEYH